eukprot:sb/3474822/
MCEVCEKSDTKYRCPKCYIRYCSLDCYKIHTCEPKAMPPPPKLPKSAKRTKPRPNKKYDGDDDDVELLKQHQLDSLDCPEMRELLSNPHLRAILRKINKSGDAELALEEHYEEPLVKEFVEQCLKLTGTDQTT